MLHLFSSPIIRNRQLLLEMQVSQKQNLAYLQEQLCYNKQCMYIYVNFLEYQVYQLFFFFFIVTCHLQVTFHFLDASSQFLLTESSHSNNHCRIHLIHLILLSLLCRTLEHVSHCFKRNLLTHLVTFPCLCYIPTLMLAIDTSQQFPSLLSRHKL